MTNLGICCSGARRFDEAMEWYAQALRVTQAARGADHDAALQIMVHMEVAVAK